MAKVDHYGLLGVSKDASPGEVTKAYDAAKAAAKGERLAAIDEAYATLSDPQKRIFYDQQLYVVSTLPPRKSKSAETSGTPVAARIKPRDAATLVIVDRTTSSPRGRSQRC
ncbi:MAG TPA: DnaJ domain-containing protein [Hyphomicrobiaceae bacterium]|nr:DnaJ domain-containing protein [Hyphomicrobiaceae bacterium]